MLKAASYGMCVCVDDCAGQCTRQGKVQQQTQLMHRPTKMLSAVLAGDLVKLFKNGAVSSMVSFTDRRYLFV